VGFRPALELNISVAHVASGAGQYARAHLR
jgi:hypothetical protein